MATYVFPNSLAVEQIAQDYLGDMQRMDPVFGLFPTRAVDDTDLRWEQRDNYRGLQAVRGLNGEPPRVKPLGFKQYLMRPGVYGEFIEIDELEITRRRQIGTFGTPIDVTDLTAEAQERLARRMTDRMRQICWTLLTTGTFSVSNENGTVTHTDTFPLTTFSAGVGWSTFATATPLANFRSVKLNHRGHSVSFGQDAVAYMNTTTLNNLLSNTNAADLYGRRTQGLGTFNSLAGVNELWTGDLLPKIVEYDEGYYNEAGTFATFIPDNKVVVVGNRLDGSPVGEWRYTRNANNSGAAPGPYMRVSEAERPPMKVRVDAGMNGGVVVYYPSAIVIMSV